MTGSLGLHNIKVCLHGIDLLIDCCCCCCCCLCYYFGFFIGL